MHPSVKRNFRSFNEPLEGVVPYMYQDVKGLVTIGVGNLIDPIEAALVLQFQHKGSGKAATRAEIEAEWTLIKRDHTLAKKGHKACAPLTHLELSNTTIDALITTRLTQNESFLKRQKAFTDFEDWPADAQLGLLSMAWAMGPGFSVHWPKFSAACAAADFDAAADNCHMSETGNPGVRKRNLADKTLFSNGAAVLAGERDGFYTRATLYYPTLLMKPITVTG
jgi:GH24 family phage-related lysozyme (muramidase)